MSITPVKDQPASNIIKRWKNPKVEERERHSTKIDEAIRPGINSQDRKPPRKSLTTYDRTSKPSHRRNLSASQNTKSNTRFSSLELEKKITFDETTLSKYQDKIFKKDIEPSKDGADANHALDLEETEPLKILPLEMMEQFFISLYQPDINGHPYTQEKIEKIFYKYFNKVTELNQKMQTEIYQCLQKKFPLYDQYVQSIANVLNYFISDFKKNYSAIEHFYFQIGNKDVKIGFSADVMNSLKLSYGVKKPEDLGNLIYGELQTAIKEYLENNKNLYNSSEFTASPMLQKEIPLPLLEKNVFDRYKLTIKCIVLQKAVLYVNKLPINITNEFFNYDSYIRFFNDLTGAYSSIIMILQTNKLPFFIETNHLNNIKILKKSIKEVKQKLENFLIE